MAPSFFEKLETRVQEINSLLCVGLEPHSKEIVKQNDDSVKTSQDKCDAAYSFCKTLIDATLPYAACYKPNAAFFEALGDNGAATLVRVLKEIPSHVPILLDVKRGDIGSTASAYAEACYDHMNADAVTLSPLMGWDSVSPFVTGTFILCLEIIWKPHRLLLLFV
jgi:uridine monophosphate synthetase